MISAESEFLVCFKVLVQGFLLAEITMQVFSDTVEYIKFQLQNSLIVQLQFSFGSSSESDEMGVKAVMKACSEI